MSDSACLTAAAAASRSPSIVLIRASACAVLAFDFFQQRAASSTAFASRGASITARTSPFLDPRPDVDDLGLQVARDHRVQVDRLEPEHRPRLDGRPSHPPSRGLDDLHARDRVELRGRISRRGLTALQPMRPEPERHTCQDKPQDDSDAAAQSRPGQFLWNRRGGRHGMAHRNPPLASTFRR